MSSNVTLIDLMMAFEPTGLFAPNASLVLGCLATVFIGTMVVLFIYMYKNRSTVIKKRATEFEKWFEIICFE